MRKGIQFLGSLGMAVGLLITIAAILAWGTFYEAQLGTASVQRFVYHSWWFQSLLFFLGINLAVAAFERYPWKMKHIPFLCAHVGIILILIGGIVGARYGIEGQLIIPEGESEHFLQLSRNILVVHPTNPGGVFVFPTRFETQAWNHAPMSRFQVPAKDKFLRLIVDRYIPDASVEEEIVPTDGQENPAVRLKLSQEGHEEEIWLFARDPNRSEGEWGKMHFLFLEAKTREELMRRVKLIQRHQPQLSNGLYLIRGPSNKIFAVLTGSAPDQRKLVQLKTGKHERHPWLNLEFSLEAFYPRAEIKEHFSLKDDDVREEALHVRLQQEEKEAEAWLSKGVPKSVLVGDEEVVLEYRKEVKELPATIKLLDFRKQEYPGTQMASSFESDVELTDPERGVVLKRTIRMNDPLKYRGFSFFQSSYIDGPQQTTVLSVRKDPGTPFVYAGFLIVVAGVVSMFFLKRENK